MPLSPTPLPTLNQSETVQPTAVRLAVSQSTDPLPADPHGQRLCEIFGHYLYCSIYADAPKNATEKPQWHTQRRYKLKNRVLYRDWQDAEKLIGVRPGHTITYALLDIDINSPYHPRQDPKAIAHIEAALETIGITRMLRIRSSWSEGIHLYLPLLEPVKTFDLAVALKNCLEPQGFKLKQGQLESFPNVKAYGNIIKTEYLAHRLPLQPASGSCLLDEALNPRSNKLDDFLDQWDIAAAGQDIQTLQQALPLARKNRFKKVRNRLGKVESWKQDLETVLAEGWSGPSQTNQLLKEFGCYGHVFLSHAGEALVDFIYQQAIASPGYRKWCRHQREIEMRSRVWATAVEKYYWPLGTCVEARQKSTNAIASCNDKKAQSAQASIKAAIRHLEAVGKLPEQATARAHAVRAAQASSAVASSSLETLYKAEHKPLWHPSFYLGPEVSDPISDQGLQPVINETIGISDTEGSVNNLPLEELKSCGSKELRTKAEIMKRVAIKTDVLLPSETKSYSGQRNTKIRESFPSTSLWIETKRPILKERNPNGSNTGCVQTNRKRNSIAKETSEAITAIQLVVQKLSWPVEKIHDFIAQKFQGRRRSQLADAELVKLLHYLQSRCLKPEEV